MMRWVMMCKGGAKSLPRRLSICHFESSFWFLTSARQEHRLHLVTGTFLGSNLELARRTSYQVVNNLHQLFIYFFFMPISYLLRQGKEKNDFPGIKENFRLKGVTDPICLLSKSFSRCVSFSLFLKISHEKIFFNLKITF